VSNRRKLLAGVGDDQLAKWRAALAEHHKQQRRQRWRRPGPQITGYRIPAQQKDQP
jgi:hypothetical protein